MSLADDARRLSDCAVRTVEWEGKHATVCHLCSWARTFWDDDPVTHSPDCPVPALPRIVAALEATEALMAVDQHEPTMAFEEGGRRYYVVCGRMMREQGHADDCPWRALVTTLRGEER